MNPPDIRLYRSNSLDILAALLAEELRTPAPGQPVLTPDTVLIPQPAIRRWLQAVLAEQHGIAANLEFLTPGELVTRALDANVPGASADLDVVALAWQLYAALTDPDILNQPVMQPLAAQVVGAPRQAWALAGELAMTFEKYQAWRRDWLLVWEAGAEEDNPQALLWRRVAGGRAYRARRIGDYLDGFEAAQRPLPEGLPRRVFAFATLSVSPDVLRVLATQARGGTLHLYVPSPTASEWGDLQTRAGQRRHLRDVADGTASGVFTEPVTEHRLLQAWGQAGRDFMRLLDEHEVMHPSIDVPVYADPLLESRPGLDAGGLADSLLHRVQSDLFHRRPQPSGTLRDTLRRDDPSVQIHACHTRLRELQVLHDQLRALLDDVRFEPPLEPREIAVLAPDIAAYAPYLSSVFAQAGEPGWLPWTLADAAALDGEPLGDAFLRLLNLPLSRFGVHEILDLIASTPLADVAGLETDALEHLRQWLFDAGARWGLNPEHRGEHQAPPDDAYTWRFALERLLLGHATGAAADIAVADGTLLAPVPELEGAALDALDRLLGLLQRLDTLRQSLTMPATPEMWQQRLLGMVDEFLTGADATPGAERIRAQLRQHINAFARSAQQAGFVDVVPFDVVQAYFVKALSDVETRAPLLTGGISFGRMVPMRLLPFRVICVLGMNDGEFPHRDPAAGLNRILTELHGGQRRTGDRSNRDDDRFLFLQLMLAAQEVFYLSYLGADPRDGSTREPSLLVSQWLDTLAEYHTDPKTARKALVVRHPLQPFSPAAFGGDGMGVQEPRRFSYHAQWAPAAGAAVAARGSLAPWFKSVLPQTVIGEDVPLDALRRFFSQPAAQFLRQRMGMRLPEELEDSPDIEPLVLPGRSEGRARQQLRQHVLDTFLHADGTDEATLYTRLRARALLPSGALGQQQLHALAAEIRPCAEAFKHWHDGQPLQSLPVQIDIDGYRVTAQIEYLHPQGLIRYSPGTPGANWVIRTGLDWLLINAAGVMLPVQQFIEKDEGGYGPHLLPALSNEQARAALSVLLRLYTDALNAPLLFAPATGWDIWNAEPDKRIQAARNKWHGSERSWGEGTAPAWQLALRGQDPFASADTTQHFIHNSLVVFAALCEGRVFEALGDLV